MFSDSVHNISPIAGFPQARRYFESTRKPPRSKRWEEHQRPLYKVSAPHYRIECFDGATEADSYYDIVHYQTPLLRYFAPKEDGSYAMLVNYYYSLTSRKLLARMRYGTGSGFSSVEEGKRVRIPMRHACKEDYTAPNGVTVPKGWSALLTYKESGMLDVSRSAHGPVHVFHTSRERRAERSTFFKQIRPYVDILMLSLPSTHANAFVCRWGSVSYRAVDELREALQLFSESDGLMTEALLHSMSNAFACAYAVRWEHWMQDKHYPLFSTIKTSTRMPEGMPMLPADMARNAFMSFLQNSLAPFSKGDEHKCLGQFPENLPRRYYATN